MFLIPTTFKKYAKTAFVAAILALGGYTAFAATTGVAPVDPVASNASPSASSSENISQVSQKITVSEIEGEVFVRKAGSLMPERVTADTDVRMGDSVKTETGTCKLLMENKTSLVLEPKTTLEITEATYDKLSQSRATLLKLDTGRLRAKIGKLAQGSKFEVLTPTALAAVRGTVFYLDAGTSLGKVFTELYVDESNGGVLFRNTKTGEAFLIPNFGASTAFGDGSLLAPRFLNENERKELVEHWENAVREVLGQQSVEQKKTEGKKTATTDTKKKTADKDKKSEQSTSGANVNKIAANLLKKLAGQKANIATIINSAILGNLELTEQLEGLSPENPDLLIQKSEGGYSVPSNPEEQAFSIMALSEGPGEGDEWSYEAVAYTSTSPFADPAVSPEPNNGDLGIVSDIHSELTAQVQSHRIGVRFEDLLLQNGELAAEMELIREIYLKSLEAGADIPALLAQAQALKESFDLNNENAQQLLQDFIEANELLQQDAAAIEAAREYERELIREEIRTQLHRIEENIEEDQRIAQFERTLDAQTGKVFTDVHGNRVRTDQYIFRPDGQSVEILSLALRAPDQISSAAFNIRFNELPESMPLKDLPWNDYLTVVTHDDLEDRLAWGQSDPGYGEYILYQSLGTNQAPDIYPTSISAEFRDPGQNSIVFRQTYSNPFTVRLEHFFFLGRSYKAQGKTSDTLIVDPVIGDTVQLTDTFVPFLRRYNTTLKINNKTISDWDYSVRQDDGAQTWLFAPDANFNGLRSTDFYVDSHFIHPSFFEQTITVDTGFLSEAEYRLSGLFIPIDNDGRVIHAPGFQIRGLRDLIHPDASVNGGNYNLEIIFSYEQNKTSRDFWGRRTSSSTSFGIDTIITPEIFLDYGRE